MPGELTTKPRYYIKKYAAFLCSFIGCPKAFSDALELRYHKIIEPDHQFCEDDDYEAKDHNDMKKHRAQSDIHNACPSCGHNTSVTIEGLRLHILTQHKSRRGTMCFGCDVDYQNPEALWGHLDKDKAPVVCRGPMHFNNARAKYNEDFRKYVWRDWMKKSGWHHWDQKRWFSEAPDWFLERLDSNNNYVPPKFDAVDRNPPAWDTDPVPTKWDGGLANSGGW